MRASVSFSREIISEKGLELSHFKGQPKPTQRRAMAAGNTVK